MDRYEQALEAAKHGRAYIRVEQRGTLSRDGSGTRDVTVVYWTAREPLVAVRWTPDEVPMETGPLEINEAQVAELRAAGAIDERETTA